MSQVELELTISPFPKQKLGWNALMDDSKRFVFFGGGAGGGKSWLAAEWLMVLAYTYPGMKAFIGRKELKRLMSSSYLTFLKVLAHHNLQDDWKLNGQYNYLESKSTGSRIDLLDLDFQPSDPYFERFGSLEYSVGWIEEAGEVDFLAFDVLKSRIGRHRAVDINGVLLASKMLLTCNPTKNWLYPNVYKLWKTGNLPETYVFIQSLYKDNPFTAELYGQNLAEITDKAMKERLMFGNWEYDDDPSSLINYEAMLDMFTNSVDEGELYLTADIARHGKDKTVIMRWNGLKVMEILTYAKQGIDDTVRVIRDLAIKYKIPFSHIVADEDGVGGGVVDMLKGIKGFVANSSPLFDVNEKLTDPRARPENFKNLKAQCYYKLADMINDHKIAVNCEDEKIKTMLIEELEQVRSKNADRDGKRAIVGKDDVKEKLGRSPDYSDTLMMRTFFLLYEKVYPQGLEDSVFSDKLQEHFRRNVSRQSMNSTK